jgi:hypothetical protein
VSAPNRRIALTAVLDFAAHLPFVGYEAAAAAPEAMKSLGFQAIAPLRVWLRESR